ncbi:MAG: 6,7-dimethyl-8-ribityllumazine synthase [Casimicrobiaceae bacterium]|nr:6,7-dimethyl-8-ribityllumazine synthase [Casimicrobiaceae bacterium]MCX8098878.1 6,7-dimethyl-8-ribityllumazine synthase [Casimicrobiaceae bacterium]MDW8312982.1 6,7-dimethyl-8-ribityllumazine synthase [Burkholderiales bacterium]
MALEPNMTLRGAGLQIGIVVSRFNEAVSEQLLSGAKRALAELGVEPKHIFVVTVPGALEIAFALQELVATEQFDALVALGAVIKGETYHFEIVANESAAGITRVALEQEIPIGNGVLTTYSEEQALARAQTKGYEAARAAVEMALLREYIQRELGAT